jgi:phage tail-like protein
MEGREVAGASNLSGLTAGGEIVKRLRPRHPSDATSHVRSEYESITIERGMTHDREFENWSRTTCEGHGQDETLRRDIVIRRYDEAGDVVGAFRFLRCWVSEVQAVPDLDANANAVAIEHLKLEHEGWERDSCGETPSESRGAR